MKHLNRIFFVLPIVLFLAYYLRVVGEKFRGTDSFDYFVYYSLIDGWDDLLNSFFVGDHLFTLFTFCIWLTGIDGHGYLYVTFVFIVLLFLIGPSVLYDDDQAYLFYVTVLLLICSSSIYLLSLNGIRQGAAATVGSLGTLLYVSQNSKLIKWQNAIWFVLAFFFHKSSLVFPVAILAYEIFDRKINPMFMLFGCLIVGLLSKQFVVILADAIHLPGISDEFLWYDNSKSGQTSIILKVGFMIVFAVVFEYLSKNISCRLHRKLVRIYIYIAGIQLLFIGYEIIVNRLLLFSSMLEPVIIVSYAKAFKRPLAYLAIISILGIAYLVAISLWHPSFRDELRFDR